jgi:radical SAM protein with 4Fe4S-binding SPASM domain
MSESSPVSAVVVRKAVSVYRGHLERGTLPSPHPWIIHLETRSLCNSRCAFCAASVLNPERPKDALMPDALIDKILDELSAIGFANRLSFYCNNEPFLDKRIVDIVARARRKAPRAYLEIKSNGTPLTVDKALQIFDAGLDVLYINDYVADGKPSPRIDALRQELGAMQRFQQLATTGRDALNRIIIATRQLDEVLYTRAGTAPNKQGALMEPLRAPCFRPFEMFTVNPAGVVAVCSDDVYFRTPMGNVNEQSIMEIWNSPRWHQMRLRLLDGDRAAYPDTCRSCDNVSPKTDLMVKAGVPIGARRRSARQAVERLTRGVNRLFS